jgi:F-type H+-transporting ATPase subunit b
VSAAARRALGLAALLSVAPIAARAAGDGVGSLVWPALNLLLLLGVLFALARKPIQGYFRDRRDRIQEELADAAQLRSEAEERYARWQRQLVDLDTELEEIRATARQRAADERERILADAHAAAERIRRDASAAVEQEVRKARTELREEASDLSIQLAAELLRGEVSDLDRDRLLDEFIQKIERPASPEPRE